jgi:hypothetical protein
MGCLIAEIASLVFGIITLATGKFTLSRNKVVYGAPARVVGVLLILILPVALGIAFMIGIMLAAQGRLVDPRNPPTALFLVEPIVFVLFFGAAMIVALANARPPRPKRLRPDEEVFEEDERDDYRRREHERRPPEDRIRE